MAMMAEREQALNNYIDRIVARDAISAHQLTSKQWRSKVLTEFLKESGDNSDK